MLQDIRSCTKLFGGVTIVFGSNFQQTLPVICKGSREEIVNATLLRSPLWKHIHTRHLRQNMRLLQSVDSCAFSDWLHHIGHGRSSDGSQPSASISIPPHVMG